MEDNMNDPNMMRKSLSQMIEVIVERGTLSREDQDILNTHALSSPIEKSDLEAMSKLTEMITSGKISVN